MLRFAPRPLPLLALAAVYLVISCGVSSNPAQPAGSAPPNPNKMTPSVTWTQPAPITNPTPLGPEQLDATANVPGKFVYSPSSGAVLAPGNQTLTTTFTPSDTTDYNALTSSVTLLVNAGNSASKCGSEAGNGAAAYVYVTSGSQDNSKIIGFSADANGSLTPLPSSPFPTTGVYPYAMATTGSLLFLSDGYNIDSFKVHADGCLALESSLAAGDGIPPASSLEPLLLFLDPHDSNLYSFDYNPPDGLHSEFASYGFDPSNGQLMQVGPNVLGGNGTLAIASNDQYAVATYSSIRGGHFIAEYRRGSNGSLSFLRYGSSPTAPPGQYYGAGGTAADGSNHILIEVSPWQGGWPVNAQPAPAPIAIYTLDDSGVLSTNSTWQNMVDSEFAPASYQFSPDYKYLAASGSLGLQVFAWNSASMSLTSIATIKSGGRCWTNGPESDGSGCSGPGFGNLAWDENDHLYTILGQQLLVYDVTRSGVVPAPDSPYSLQNPQWVTVQSQ